MEHRDLEGRTVLDSEGNRIGTISDVYIDQATQRPEWGLIHTGLFGTKQTFVPLIAATSDGEDLRVPYTKSKVTEAPNVEADGEISVEEEAALAQYYGLGYSTEESPTGVLTGGQAPEPRATGTTEGASMVRSEEEMRVGTMRRPSELARLRKTVVTEPVSQTVPLQREELRVQREAITTGDIEGGTVPEIGEQVHEVTLSQEEPVVEKRTVPVERVTLDKEVVVEEREVTGEVRKEQIEVDRQPQR